MQTASTPVSEVLRNAESQISRANDIRRRAAELYAQAARLQEEAYLDAVAELGEEDGGYTYRLACRSAGVDPADRTGAASPSSTVRQSVAPVAAEVVTSPAAVAPPSTAVAPTTALPPVPAVPSPAHVPVPQAEPVRVVPRAPVSAPPPHVTPAPVQADDPSRLDRYGVLIKRSKLAEAEEVIAQAQRTVAQNRKTNPYSDDRGRNAWRNTLFAAVLAQEAPSHAVPGQALAVVPESDVPQYEEDLGYPPSVLSYADDAEASGQVPPHDENPGEPPSGILTEEPEDDVLDDELPSRSVPFTRNPAQADVREPTAQETQSKAPAFMRQPPPFVRPGSETPARKSPEVHVSRPIHNRPVGFGQSVPAPPGLSDTISRLNSGQADQGSAPVTTPRPPTTRPAPPFIRSK